MGFEIVLLVPLSESVSITLLRICRLAQFVYEMPNVVTEIDIDLLPIGSPYHFSHVQNLLTFNCNSTHP